MPDRTHWDEVYASRPSDSLSWHQQGGCLTPVAGANVSLVPMSATVGDDQTKDTLSLSETDLAVALVQQRLRAAKALKPGG